VRALLFLYVRVFVNGIKRALSSPTRILGVLFFILIQFTWLGRVLFQGSVFGTENFGTPGENWTLPPVPVIESVVFGGFCLLTMLFVLSLFNIRATFRAADVDVLFPTPIDPKTVLVVRVLRDIWLSLLVPLVFALLLWRPAKIGWASLFADVPNPEVANIIFQVATVAYLLSAIAWVWIGHAVSMAFSKPDVRTDRLRMFLSWIVGLAYLGVLGSIYLRAKDGDFPDVLVQIAHALDVRIAFFLATAATSLTMAPLTNNWTQGLIGMAGLIGVTVITVVVARSKTEWFYELAALRTNVTETTQKLRRNGDMMAIVVGKAQSGKLKAGRKGWLHRLTVKGPWAMVWKEAIVMNRTSRWSTVLFTAMSVLLSFMVCLIPINRRGEEFNGVLLLVMQSMVMLGPAMGFAQAGFIESLRRIDLLKPIPFKSSTIVFFEVLCKAVGSWFSVVVGLLTALVLKPALWQYVVGGLIMFPALTLALSSVSLLLVLLLPDIDDPTQRGFRGLATMLGMIAVSGPPVILFAVLIWIKVPVALASLFAASAMVGIAWLATLLAGRTYENFNPAD